MRFLALLLSLLPAVRPAFAARAETAVSVDAFQQRVTEVALTAADPDKDYVAVRAAGAEFFDDVPRTAFRVEGDFRRWDFGRDRLGDGREVSVAELVTAGQEAVTDLNLPVPAPDALKDAVAGSADSFARGRMGYTSALAPGQMGLFRYVAGRVETGFSDLNQRLAEIAGVIGARFAYATIRHERDHEERHRRGELSPEQVVEGEISAFQAQYEWLVHIDPHGERLVYAAEAVANQIRNQRGGALAVDCQRYLDHLMKVRATGGERRRVIALIEELGYREGHHHGDGHNHDGGPAPGVTSA